MVYVRAPAHPPPSFRGAPKGANPESRGKLHVGIWIPGSALARRPGMTAVIAANVPLIQRLEFQHLRGVIVADPDRHRLGPIVDEHAAEVAVARQRIVHPIAGLGIEPPQTVGGFIDLPD